MVLNGVIGQSKLGVSLRENWFVVMFDCAEALTYDRGGRLWSYFRAGRTYRRGLDGRILVKWQEGGARQRRWLTPPEIERLIDDGAARMRMLRTHVKEGQVAWATPPENGELVDWLDRAGRYDAQAAKLDRQQFARVYDPIGILPPDQYLSLVLQASLGCSFNTCTFCNFYSSSRFIIRSPQAFREHAREVRAFLGDSIGMRRSIFLGEANALMIPFNRLAVLMSIAHEEFGERPIHAFLDAFNGARKSIAEYQMLASLGLKRVSIGLESGHDPLLHFVRKPSQSRNALDTVAALKTAGIGVSVIVLIGLGGDRYADGHVAGTIALLNEMPLSRGDIVYFSNLVERPGAKYSPLARAQGIHPLTTEEMKQQRQAIRSGLRFGMDGPTLSTYDIHEFVY